MTVSGRSLREMLAFNYRAPVAQGIEHWFPEPGVVGSNPAGGTK